MPGRIIKVECQCGKVLFKYFKGGRGRLIKCFLEEIRKDYIGLDKLEAGSDPLCPSCGKRLGQIRLVHGRPALKLNQGAIRENRI